MRDVFDEVLGFDTTTENMDNKVSYSRESNSRNGKTRNKKRKDLRAEESNKEKTTIYLTAEQRKIIKKYAIDIDMSMTDFIITTVMEKIKKSKT